MRPFVKLFYFLLILLLSACANRPNVRTIPIEDFFKNPEKTSFKISPDGKYVSFLQPYRNRLNIFVQPIGGDQALQLTADSDRNISYYFWANNDQLLYLKDKDGDENRRLFAVNRDGSNVRELIPDKDVRIRIIALDRIKNNQILLALNKRDSSIFDAYRLDILTGKISLVALNPGNITDWIADADGQLRAAVASDGVNTTVLYRTKENQKFRTLFSNNFKTSIKPLGFCKESDCMYALSNDGRDKTALVEID
jgi:Tol biopolymer transport system component